VIQILRISFYTKYVYQGTNYEEAFRQIQARSGVSVLEQFKSSVFSDVSIETATDNVETLQGLPVVSTAWKFKMIKLMPTVDMTTFSTGIEASNYSVHSMTGVDKVHAAGHYGKGVKVAIVDTGIQWSHPTVSIYYLHTIYVGLRGSLTFYPPISWVGVLDLDLR
jgi:hypothetical protein